MSVSFNHSHCFFVSRGKERESGPKEEEEEGAVSRRMFLEFMDVSTSLFTMWHTNSHLLLLLVFCAALHKDLKIQKKIG